MLDVSTADKDQLVKLAKDEFNVTIDPRTKIETIRTRVQNLVEGKPDIADEATPAAKTKSEAKPVYVLSSTNGQVYEWQPHFEGCDWLTPCDIDGNTV